MLIICFSLSRVLVKQICPFVACKKAFFCENVHALLSRLNDKHSYLILCEGVCRCFLNAGNHLSFIVNIFLK